MKLEENNIIVKRSYKTVYKCDDSIVKVFNEEHPKSDVFNEALITARIEETGLDITECRYLFSIPNLYMYCGFEVHTVDMFFECHVKDFTGVHAEDDAAEIVIVKKEELKAEEFGLMSIKKAIRLYKENNC